MSYLCTTNGQMGTKAIQSTSSPISLTWGSASSELPVLLYKQPIEYGNDSYVTIVFLQYGGLLAARNRRVSILNSNPLWGPRRNLAVPLGMIGTALIAVVNLYGHGLQRVFATTPIPGMFWGIPFGFALAILIADEIRKLLVRTYPKVRYYNPFGFCSLSFSFFDLVHCCKYGLVTFG